jgi:hypothetical protein
MRSTETALQLITEKFHIIWGGYKHRVASLLSLDVSGASDRTYARDEFRNRLPDGSQTSSQDRETEVRIDDFTLESSRIFTGITQGSRVSDTIPIL